MSKRRIDKSTISGIVLALAGVVAALVLDGGSLKQILQPTAAHASDFELRTQDKLEAGKG